MADATHTPSTLAHELIYSTRDLTMRERAYLTSYHRITMRTVRAKTAAWDMFGRTSQAAAAAIWLAECEEKIDLKRALVVFNNEGLTDQTRRTA